LLKLLPLTERELETNDLLAESRQSFSMLACASLAACMLLSGQRRGLQRR